MARPGSLYTGSSCLKPVFTTRRVFVYVTKGSFTSEFQFLNWTKFLFSVTFLRGHIINITLRGGSS